MPSFREMFSKTKILSSLVTWIPGTPNYEKTKNNHKALI
jgi:hypothetical protein